MKTLYINGKFLSQPVTGVQRYARDVVSAWDDDLEEGKIDRSRFSIQVVAPRTSAKPPDYRHVQVIRSRFDGKLWEQGELTLRTMGAWLFSPYAAAPLAKRRHLVTIHDAGVVATPGQYSRSFRLYYSLVFRTLGKRCPRIFTVSRFSREELHRYFSIPLEKLAVVPPGCDHLQSVEPNRGILQRFDLAPGKFILGVSSQSPIKNFRGLAEAWRLLGRGHMKLAIAGKANARIFQQTQSTSDAGVTWLGYVSDAELRALYENAALFAYPSFYEGFGYPPLEAMSCGCPVVVARSSALPETCGDAAVYCDPSSPEDIAGAIARVLDDPRFAETLREKGRRHAAQFTIRGTASRLWAEICAYF